MQTSNSPSRSKGARVQLPRVGLQLRVYLFGLAILGCILLGVVAVMWASTNVHAYRLVDTQIDQGMVALERGLQIDSNDVESIGRWVVDDKTFHSLVEAGDKTGLNRHLQPLINTSIVDFILVTDSKGNVLTQLVAGAPNEISDTSIQLFGISEALAGQESSRMDRELDGELYQKSILPIYDNSVGNPRGALSIGFRVDAAYLQRASNRRTVEYALVSDNRFMETTLTDRLGRRWEGNFATFDVDDLFNQFRPSDLSALFTDQGQFLFKFKPWGYSGDSQIKLIGVGVRRSVLEDVRSYFLRWMWFPLGVGLLALGVSGFFFAQNLIDPLQRMGTALDRMSKGDLTTKVGVQRTDEIGDLAWDLEQLRKTVLHEIQRLLQQVEWDTAVLGSLSEPVVITNAKHHIAQANSAALGLLRRGGEDVIGQPWHSFFAIGDNHNEPVPFWHPKANLNDANNEIVVRGRFPLRAQPEVVLDITSTQVDVANMPEGYVHVLRDVSEVEHLTRAQDQFLLNVAHELQGPLASWRASLELLVEDYPNLSSRDLGVMLKSMERSAIKFEGLIEVLIDIGKLEAGRFKIRPTPTHINKLVQDGLATIGALLATKGQVLKLQLDSPPTCMVLADRPRIIQVVINLVKNASKYSPEDQPIEVSVYRQAGYAFVEVVDHGNGISPEDQEHLFQRFFRGKRTEDEGGGIGIGLALCKGIIDAHRGQIGVRSRLGEGTTVWFSLPELDQTRMN